MIVEFNGRIDPVLCCPVSLVIKGVPVFGAEGDSAEGAYFFIEDSLGLGKLLFLVHPKSFIVHPKNGVGEGLRLVEGVLLLLADIVQVGAVTRAEVHFPAIAEIFPPAEVIVPVVVGKRKRIFHIETVPILPAQTEVIVSKSGVVLDDTPACCTDTEISLCLGN